MDFSKKHVRARLPQDVIDAAFSYGARTSWPAGFEIYERGSPADGLFILLSGHVVLRNRVRGNRGFIPGLVGARATFGGEGLMPAGTYATDAEAAFPAETLFLSNHQFHAFVRERPTHAISLIGEAMAQRADLLNRLHELAVCNVKQRVVSCLLRMAEERAFTSDDGRLRLNAANHRILCEMVGATRESISLALSRLVAEGLAERNGSGFLIAPPRTLTERWRTISDEEIPRLIASEPAHDVVPQSRHHDRSRAADSDDTFGMDHPGSAIL